MTARKSKAKAPAEGGSDAVQATMRTGETKGQAVARSVLSPDVRHGVVNAQILQSQMAKVKVSPGVGDYADALGEIAANAAGGDLAFASRLLAAQAVTLDNIFAEMARRMALNMGEYMGATETYGRIAMKAQAGSRAAIETLAKLHQPREQTVRHVHVNEGGQAVIADQFHHHTGAGENGKSSEQPHATESGTAGTSPALPCPDPLGPAVPLASGEGQGPVPDARRQGKRRTCGQP